MIVYFLLSFPHLNAADARYEPTKLIPAPQIGVDLTSASMPLPPKIAAISSSDKLLKLLPTGDSFN